MDNLPPPPITPENPPVTGQPVNPKNYLTVRGFLILVFIFISFTLLAQLFIKTKKPEPQPSPAPTPSNWKTYTDQSNRFSFKYPPEYSVEVDNENIDLLSPQTNCYTGAYGSSSPIIGYDLNMTFNPHVGKNYAAIWQQAFGFDFSPPHDGITSFDGKVAHYFYQSAEMPYARTAYLVELTPTTALEINVETPELINRCDRPIDKYRGLTTAKTILSTLKFPGLLPSPTPQSPGKFCGGIAGLPCPAGYICQLDGSYPDAGGTCVKRPVRTGCKTSGCSSELCLDTDSQDMISICIYKAEYACLKYSACERQANGQCAWTQSPKYQSCIQNLSSNSPL